MSALSIEQQRLAFLFLGHRARTAHREGDGVLVNHLCATALGRLAEHTKAQTLRLSMREVAWVLILPQFWLIDEYLLDAAKKEIDLLQPATPAEHELREFLRRYHRLIDKPFLHEAVPPAIVDASLAWLQPEYRVEDEVLLTHLIELVWIRAINDTGWSDLAGSWSKRGDDWVKVSLERLTNRLRYQAAMVEFLPRSSSPKPTLPDDEEWLAQLWEATLDCDWKQIDEILAEHVPVTGSDSPRVRFLFDFRHFNRVNGVWGDDQATGLTRRRLAITAFPKLGFDGIRAAKSAEAYATGLRKREKYSISHFIESQRLAMLSEIEALRLWDVFEWTESVGRQSRILMELVKRHPENIDSGFGALRLALQAMNFDEGSPAIRETVNALDFGSAEARTEFFGKLLLAPDLHAYTLLEVFSVFGDAIPQNVWDGLAEWSLKYTPLAKSKRLRGSKAMPLAFWRFILPFVPRDHLVWAKLQPEVMREARVPMNWQVDDGLIPEFICHGPIEQSAEVLRQMIGVNEGGVGDKRLRWERIAEVLRRRPELREEFVPWAIEAAPSPSYRHHLHVECGRGTDPVMEDEARADIRQKTLRLIEESKLGEKADALFNFRGRTPVTVSWRSSDRDFFLQMLDAIDGSQLKNTVVPTLIMFALQIAYRGPDDFVDVMAHRLAKWTDHPPGRVPGNYEDRPWGSGNAEIAAEVAGELADALDMVHRRTHSRHGELVLVGARRLMQGLPDAAPELIRLQLGIAHRGDPAAQVEAMNAIRVVLAVAWGAVGDEKREARMANIMNVMGWFVRTGYESNGVRVIPSDDFVQRIVVGLDPLLCAFARSTNVQLRQMTAVLLRSLAIRKLLSPSLERVFERLRDDARGRVRAAACEC